MSPEQQRFFQLLGKYQFAMKYWKQSTCHLNIDAMEADFPLLGSGEVAFLKFLAAVWTGRNVLHFDFIADSRAMRGKLLKDYQQWVSDPFHP